MQQLCSTASCPVLQVLTISVFLHSTEERGKQDLSMEYSSLGQSPSVSVSNHEGSQTLLVTWLTVCLELSVCLE